MRSLYPKEIDEMISLFRTFPSIGLRSAERIVLWLLDDKLEKKHLVNELINNLKKSTDSVNKCSECGFWTNDNSKCIFCEDENRDTKLLCIVEDTSDVVSIEKSRYFKGLYHCLGGKLSPLDSIGPEELNIKSLLQRIKTNQFDEIILALGTDIEGETTANFIIELLNKNTKNFANSIKISKLAYGLPAGGALEYADELTLMHALKGRIKC